MPCSSNHPHQGTQAQPSDAANQLSAEMALLLCNAIRQSDMELFREVIREIATSIDDVNAKWVFKITQLDLTADQQQWLEQAIAQIREGNDGE